MSDVAKHKPADLAVKKSKRDAGSEIDAFVQRSRALKAAAAKEQGHGRLIFALDATYSRQSTWDAACELQAEMFREVSSLDIQIVYYRGVSECRSSGWVSSSERLANLMSGITCRAGTTQIGRILAHARRETEKTKVAALAFVGDAMEENLDELAAAAGELGKLGVKAFVFQEGDNPKVEFRLPGDCQTDPRSLLPFRCWCASPIGGTASGGCSLCGWRGQGT